MTKKEYTILEHIISLLDELWHFSDSNNVLEMDYAVDEEQLGQETITIPEGTYTTSELETEIADKLNDAFSKSCSVEYADNKWSISAEEGEDIYYVETGSTAGTVLGFTEDQNAETITSDTEVFYFFPYVSFFPDSIEKIGSRYPALLIGDEDQVFSATSGARVLYDWTVSIFLYSTWRQGDTRVEKMLEYQNVIITEMLEDLSLDSNAANIEPISVEKGEYNPNDEDRTSPGYYQSISVRKINFNIQVYDDR